MTSIVCGSCAATVPYGRLSCPSCGELLASVAGARRGGAASLASASTATALPAVLYDAATAPAVDVDGDLEHPRDDEAMDRAVPWSGYGSSAAEATNGTDHAYEATNGTDHAFEPTDDDGGLDGLLTDDEDDAPSSSPDGPTWAVAGGSLSGPATPTYMPRPPRSRAPMTPPPALPAASGPGALMASAAGALAADLPGAYVPPLPVAATVPAGPVAPARAWAGHSGDPDTAGKGDAKTDTNAGIDASRLAEFVGSVSIAGAALAAVGFLLPWASVVIGSNGSGYFDRWGLAGQGHVVVVLAILAILALSIVKNPIPIWVRTGVAGLAIGALLLGLSWPYLLNPALEAAPGVLIETIGAIALIVAGVLAIATDRHAEAPKVV